jgi:hypothetical protein
MLTDALKAALSGLGLTATELSRRSGVHQVVISLVFTGKRAAFSKEAAPKIYAALGGDKASPLSLTELLGIPTPPPAAKRARRG